MTSADAHQRTILDQFTRQARPFAAAAPIRSDAALRLVVDFSGASSEDTVLDVACGPGVLACAFAKRVRHAAGIDITPAMVECAREEASTQGLSNLSWILSDVTRLPCRTASYTLVVSRFAMHHFLEPLTVLREMRRVCAPGGRVVVVDSSPAAGKAAMFNRMETLRDPSHVRAMPMEDLEALFAQAGLQAPKTTTYRLQGDLDSLLQRSFFAPADEATIRRLFADALVDDAIDLQVRRDGALMRYGFPVAVLAATVPDSLP